MSNEEREALATALSRTIRLSVAISVALAMMIVLVTNHLQNQAINRRIDEIEQMMKQRPQEAHVRLDRLHRERTEAMSVRNKAAKHLEALKAAKQP